MTRPVPGADALRRGGIQETIGRSLYLMTLGLVVVFFIIWVTLSSYQKGQHLQATQAQVATLAAACIPALMFQDERAADQLLGTLAQAPAITGAHLLLPSGETFASYGVLPAGVEGYRSETLHAGQLIVRQAVVFDAERIGELVLAADLSALQRQERRLMVVFVLLTLVLLGVTAVVSRVLARRVANPLVEFAEAADAISQSGDYRRRLAPRREDDEIALFARVFNAMLDAVEQRDQALNQHKENLEVMVVQRTADLALAKEQAEAANRAKSAFIANMSHELRTPLNALLGYAQVLRRDRSLDAHQLHSVETIQHSGEHLLTLINDLLDLAKIEADRIEIHNAPCDLGSIFTGLIGLFQAAAAHKGLHLRHHQLTPLPGLVNCDERRLRQIGMNLLGNAVKFTEQGEIRLALAFRDGWLEVSVEDTGIGIPEARLCKLFRPFEQAGEEHYRSQGTGLGLAIGRQLAEHMGGRLEVQSRLGEGSRFTLEVPLEVLDLAPTPSVKAEHLPVGVQRDGEGRPLRVLVVDDALANRQVISALLAPLGFEMLAAEGGHQALAIAQDTPPDLVVMDLVMDPLDGLETTRRLLAIPGLEQLPVLACSASAFAQDRDRCLEAGCIDFLPKPVDAEQLFAMLERYLPLRWVYAGREEEGQGATLLPEAGLDPALLEALRTWVTAGQISRIQRTLNEREGQLGTLGKRMQEAALRFDIKTLKALLERA